jgi:hypothetical protein
LATLEERMRGNWGNYPIWSCKGYWDVFSARCCHSKKI